MVLGKNIAGYQGLFLALTLVVMIIIILVTKDLTTAILIIGLITNYLIISSHLTLIKQRHENGTTTPPGSRGHYNDDGTYSLGDYCEPYAPGSPSAPSSRPAAGGGGKEGYWPQPGAGPPHSVQVPKGLPYDEGYRGAIDAAGDIDHDSADTAPWGHPDRTAYGSDYMAVGNPYDLDRIGSPGAAPPGIDDEAIGGLLDADELNTYHARSRNDNTRVWAGAIRRKEFMDRYLREELEEEEDSQWWGRHEW